MTTFQFASIGHSWCEWKRIASTSRPLSATISGSRPSDASSGAASGSGLTNTNGPQRVDRDGRERQARGVEAGLALGPGRPTQRAVEVVRPRVVRALQRLAAAGALDDEMAAVPADVDEPAQDSRRSRGRRRPERGRSAPRSTSRAPAPTRPGRRTSTTGRTTARARASRRRRPCTSSPEASSRPRAGARAGERRRCRAWVTS